MVNKLLTLSQPCLCCGLTPSNSGICQACSSELPWQQQACQQCALPLADPAACLCGHCLSKPPSFSKTYCGWRYEFPISQLLNRFKHHRDLTCGRQLAQLFAKRLTQHYQQQPMPDLLVATPLHWRRLLSRGFNQSEVISEELSKQLDIPIAKGVKRVKATPRQQGLDRKHRQRNLCDAFKCTGSLTGKRIAIVDDVMTTGATGQALSQCLINAGAEEAHLWCLARTDE